MPGVSGDESKQGPDAAAASPAWGQAELRDPHAAADKAQRVQRMFAAIARSYDLNNRLHSMGQDQAWRRRTVRRVGVKSSDIVLDAACGTGDLAMAFRDAGAGRVIGVDFTHEMLEVARGKSPRGGAGRRADAAAPSVAYADGDAMRLPLADRSVDVVSIAFGIRNVSDPARAIGEFHRVLRPGGRLAILEFSLPTHPLLRWAYQVYFQHVLPRTATWISRDRTGAYRYLPRSVNTFASRDAMTRALAEAGFTGISLEPLTLGIAVIYLGRRT